MKHFLLIAILISAFSGAVYAEETETDCPMMAERNERENPKQAQEKAKVVKPSDGSTAQ